MLPRCDRRPFGVLGNDAAFNNFFTCSSSQITRMPSLSYKLYIDEEVRRVSLEGEQTFRAIFDVVATLFKQIQPSRITLKWTDEDGDDITISSDIELQEAIRAQDCSFSSQRAVKLKIGVSQTDVVGNADLKAINETGKALSKPFSDAIHYRISCDECGVNPIRGIRYKCTFRKNYDLCEVCEAKGSHPYAMVKICTPRLISSNSHRNGQIDRDESSCSWRKAQRDKDQDGLTFPTDQPSPPPFYHPPNHHPRPLHGHVPYPHFHPHPHPHHRHHDHWLHHLDPPPGPPGPPPGLPGPMNANPQSLFTLESQDNSSVHFDRKDFVGFDSSVRADVRSTARSPSKSAMTKIPKAALRLVKDITFPPDSSSVLAGSIFQKIWKVRNDGTVPWPVGCFLATAGGDALCSDNTKVLLPVVNVGEEVDITIDLCAPRKAGTYTAYFRAQTDSGQQFGHRLWSTITVIDH